MQNWTSLRPPLSAWIADGCVPFHFHPVAESVYTPPRRPHMSSCWRTYPLEDTGTCCFRGCWNALIHEYKLSHYGRAIRCLPHMSDMYHEMSHPVTVTPTPMHWRLIYGISWQKRERENATMLIGRKGTGIAESEGRPWLTPCFLNRFGASAARGWCGAERLTGWREDLSKRLWGHWGGSQSFKLMVWGDKIVIWESREWRQWSAEVL